MKYKICIVTTMSSSIDNWVKPFFDIYNQNNFEITVISNMSQQYIDTIKNEYPYVQPINIEMPRGTSFFGTLKSIRKLYKHFKMNKYDLIQYSTPNASFYSAIASKLAKIPIRLYAQWGMVYVTMRGIKKFVFKGIERITCRFSTNIQPDSHGNLEFGISEKLYKDYKGEVIWNGSAKGIDLQRFDINKKNEFRSEIRQKYSINKDDFVIGFVGRLGRDKGCNELFEAFQIIEREISNCKLLFVGPIEKENTIRPDLLKWFYESKNVIITNRVNQVEKYFAAMDVFILPSYREGFGMSVVESQAMGIPVIASDIPGPRNGLIDGTTGFLIKPKDSDGIYKSVVYLYKDTNLAIKMGKNGVDFVKKNFDSKTFKEKLISNRKSLIEKHKEKTNS